LSISHLTLYPFLKPYRQFRLTVDAPHALHIEESGNPAGLPVVFLHGGPGAGTEPYHRRFFDPAIYRIVLFDQRGCGHSTPHASLENNTTQALIEDMERIRRELDIDRWVVFGGSWGSTLGLAYAESYPSRVLGLILRGVFLCRERDIQWFYQDGASRIFPDHWKDFVALIPDAYRDDILAAYHRMLTSSDEVGRMAAAKAWSIWEGRTATLKANPDVVKHFANPHIALSLARIECHYFVNQSFLEPDQLLRNAQRLRGIPGVIVHGRYDVICPLEQAYALREVWPEAKLDIVPGAGHAAGEPGIVDALIKATREIAALYS
jgi:proline iminopeptidase